jgi:hypothetical protein
MKVNLIPPSHATVQCRLVWTTWWERLQVYWKETQEAKLSLSLIKYHSSKKTGTWRYTSWHSYSRNSLWLVSRPGRFIPREKTHSIQRKVITQGRVGRWETWINFCPCRESNHDSSVVLSVAWLLYWATTAPEGKSGFKSGEDKNKLSFISTTLKSLTRWHCVYVEKGSHKETPLTKPV